MDVLQGVLPLQDGQQGLGGTLQLLIVNNTEEKVTLDQHSIVARGTVVKVAPPQYSVVNMVQGKPPPAGRAVPPPVKVGTQLSPKACRLCQELKLEERYHLKGN